MTDEEMEQYGKGKAPFGENLYEHLADDSTLFLLQAHRKDGRGICSHCKGSHPCIKPGSPKCCEIDFEMTKVPRLTDFAYDPVYHVYAFLPGEGRHTWEYLSRSKGIALDFGEEDEEVEPYSAEQRIVYKQNQTNGEQERFDGLADIDDDSTDAEDEIESVDTLIGDDEQDEQQASEPNNTDDEEYTDRREILKRNKVSRMRSSHGARRRFLKFATKKDGHSVQTKNPAEEVSQRDQVALDWYFIH